jgi:CO/xanthine dehydrogenase Mo-binding subunit
MAKARYVGDLVVPGMIEGKFLRSLYAHARILSIDTRQAEALPGNGRCDHQERLDRYEPIH